MRAIAVVAVMVYHANSSWLPGGFLGVEVFFIISGYLITLLLLAEHEKNSRLDLKQFWIRRARRLLPALVAMMSAVVEPMSMRIAFGVCRATARAVARKFADPTCSGS